MAARPSGTSGIITLLTDFGLEDEYGGVVKGVILTINPKALIVDLSHQVPPGDVARAGRLLAWAWGYFPKGTIHVVVVDPGVGSDRKILCLTHQGHLFLAPDNGVLSFLLAGLRRPKLFEVSNRRYALKKISHTFHGRDLFAPAAAHLSLGVSPRELGPPVKGLVRLPVDRFSRKKRGVLIGQVIHIDRFGNAVSNLPGELCSGGTVGVWAKGRPIRGIVKSYAAVPAGRALATIGSHDLLEIAVRDGSAAQRLRLRIGDRVEVR